MFDNIHFMRNDLTSPLINEHMLADVIAEYMKQNDIALPENYESSESADAPWEASFHLSGISQVIMPSVVSSFAESSLFYVQSFSVFDMNEAFFTRRSNYASYEFLYTYDGSGILEYEGQKYELSTGEGFLIDCQKTHYYKTVGEHWHHCVFHFNGPLAQHYYEKYIEDGSVKFSFTTDTKVESPLQNFLERLASAYDSIGPYNELQISLEIQNILMLLITDGKDRTKKQKQIPENLLLLIRYINNNYDKNLSLDFLSDFSCYSKYYMCRLFKEHTGYSPNDYIINLRIHHAKEYLQTTSLPANKIGQFVGFKNTNYFYRIFKKKTGLSPEEFRRR